MNRGQIVIAGMLVLNNQGLGASDFSLDSFEWGDIPSCTSGSPNRVTNPTFVLSNVPENTKYISFYMKDKDAPSYRHGGGVVEYSGGSTIVPGQFKYLSPCPPGGKHTYEWTATAKSKKKKGKIAAAKAKKKYPE